MKMNYLYTPELKKQFLGEGEWLDEPDEVFFKHKDYDCKILRVFEKEPFAKELAYFGGHLCGYVAIPCTHPFYQKPYSEINIDAHGGLTFGECSDRHWIGFDCAHSGDYTPSMEHLRKTIPELIKLEKEQLDRLIKFNMESHWLFKPTYKNVEFCVQECKSMVDQLCVFNHVTRWRSADIKYG